MKVSKNTENRVHSTLQGLLNSDGETAKIASQYLQEASRTDADDEDGRWVTTESGKKMFINGEGEPTKGNPHVLAAAKGEIKPASSGASGKPKQNVSSIYDPSKKLGRKELEGMDVGSQVVMKDGRVLRKTGDSYLPWHVVGDKAGGDRYSSEYLANSKEGACSPVSNGTRSGSIDRSYSGGGKQTDSDKAVRNADNYIGNGAVKKSLMQGETGAEDCMFSFTGGTVASKGNPGKNDDEVSVQYTIKRNGKWGGTNTTTLKASEVFSQKVFKPKSGYQWDNEKKKNVYVEDIGPLEKMKGKKFVTGDVATVTLADGTKKSYTAKWFSKPGFNPGFYWEDNSDSRKQFGTSGGTLAAEFRNGVIDVEVRRG